MNPRAIAHQTQHRFGDALLVLSERTASTYSLDAAAAALWAACDGQHSVQALCEVLMPHLPGPDCAAFVRSGLEQLRAAGLVDWDTQPCAAVLPGGPRVKALELPSALLAASACRRPGEPCQNAGQCCTGLLCGLGRCL